MEWRNLSERRSSVVLLIAGMALNCKSVTTWERPTLIALMAEFMGLHYPLTP